MLQKVFFEEALEDEPLQVLPEASAVDGLVPLTIVVKAVFFYSGEYGILDCFRTSHQWLVLNGVENFVDGEPQQKCFVGL